MMSRKILSLLSVLVLLCTIAPLVRAEDQTVFGPSDFEIGSLHLHFSRHTFHVDDPGDGYIIITKNTPNIKIQGGFLFFNGKFVPLRQFFIGDDVIVYKDRTLNSSNRLTVFLRGTPGASVTIDVRRSDSPVSPPEVTFSAEPMSITLGESTTLTWQTSHADIVTIDHDIGDVSASGSEVVTPQETTTYTLAAIGQGGSTTETVTITVNPLPPTVEIDADPDSIHVGESATLIWASTNAESCVIEPDLGVVGLEGSANVSPSETTTYKIVATGDGGTAGDEVTVTVTDAPPTAEINAAPDTIMVGESAILSWTTTNASSCVIQPDIGTVDPSGSTSVSPTETTTYTITATGPGGTSTDTVTVTVLQPPTVSLSADPETILSGESSTLSWNSTNADSATIDQGVGTVPVNGSISVSPSETTTFTITVTGSGGTATASVTVTVTYPPPIPTVSLSADPGTILLGESTTLTWTSEHADTCVIDPGVGSVDPNGSTAVSPSETTTYTIIATGPGGTAADTVTVTVLQPPTASLSADPETILLGESSTLTWSSTYTDTCVIEPDVGTVDPSGSTTVSPTETTTYTITATGSGGSATDSVTVTVIYPPTVSLSADPDTIVLGESSTLSWSSTHADTCVIEPGVGSVDVNGAIAVSPTETTTYTITATGLGGTATDTVTVTVLYPPTVNISADPETIEVGQSATLSWTSTNADSASIDQGIGSVPVDGSMPVSPTETTTYTITATGPGGTATDSVTVTVTSTTPTVSISAAPETIQVGESSTLSWTSTNAQSAHIDNGIGVVSVDGSTIVSPEHTTTYTITVTGSTGSASAQAVVMVLASPEPQPEGSFGEQYEDLIPPDATVESYDPKRFSVITGLVQDLAGTPIADVAVTIHDHPEYGTVATDADGGFSIPVEGGGTITLVYQKDGLLAVQRKVYVPWNDIAIAETIQMIAEDPAATTLTFDGDPATVVTHQSTEYTDDFGSRSCTMVFTGDNMAHLVDEAGNDIHQLTTITTRATEYTTPESMPAILPPNSAYTYCVELAVDGAQRVRFENPVITWVDNFLGFAVGDVVPVGYYDRDRGVWVPEDNGVVVRLLDMDTDGIVDALDADGDDQPDDLNEDSTYSDEVAGLGDPGRYPPGSTFWRVAVTHFTPRDLNWPGGGPGDATGPSTENAPQVDQQKNNDCQSSCCSFVEERSRILHEDIPIPGTDTILHFASNRVSGYHHKIVVPASGETVPDSLTSITVKVEVAGRTFDQTLPPLPNQVVEFVWDGLDHLSRPVKRPAIAHVCVSFNYEYVYLSSGFSEWAGSKAFAQMGGSMYSTSIVARQSWGIPRCSDLVINTSIGDIAEGWTLSTHHYLSPIELSTLYKGDGTIIENNAMIIETAAGNGAYGFGGDGGPATDAPLGGPRGVAMGPDGSIYIGDYGSARVRRVDPDGIITTFAGGGTNSPDGGGPALEAHLTFPSALAVGPDGSVFISDSNIVYRVSPNGNINKVAGGGTSGLGDGGPATEAQLNSSYAKSLAVDPEGNLYIPEYHGFRVRRVSTDGIITTVAGNGTPDWSGDGGPATQASLFYPHGVAVGPEGSLYISTNYSLRRVNPEGIITTVAFPLSSAIGVAVGPNGTVYVAANSRIYRVGPDGILIPVGGDGTSCSGSEFPCGDGGLATQAGFTPWALAMGPDGSLCVADRSDSRIRKLAPPSAFIKLMSAGDIVFAEEGGLGHIMSSAGRHKTTIDLDAGVTLREFGYNEENQLISITDRFDNVITIDRDGSGVPTAITSPDGITTTLTIDGNNHLTRITYPDGSYYGFEYTADGLLTAKIEPKGNRFEHVFDSIGRLTDATDQEDGHWNYTRTAYENGDILTEVLTGEGNLTSYLDYFSSTGAYSSTITDPTGAETLFTQSVDGLAVNKSLACGMELAFKYDVDLEYTFKYINEMTESTPAALGKVTLREKTYQDTNSDEVPDLITEAVTVNGKATTIQNNVLQSRKDIVSPEGRTVTTLYDPATLVTTSLTIPGLYETMYGYDLRGRLTSIYTNTRETTLAYDTQGFLESITDPEDHTTTYTYDAVGRMTQINRPDGSTIGFTYDQNGNMTVLTNPSIINHGFAYSLVNLNSSYQTPLSGSYSYVYDKDRRLVQTNFPSGNQINNVYDKTKLVQIQTPEGNIALTYLCGTKIGSISKGTETITYGYDGLLVTSETLSGMLNQSLSYGYNNDFNMNSFTYAGDSHIYTYDDDGLLTGAGGFTIFRNAANGLPEAVTGGALDLTRSFNGYGEVDTQDFTVSGSSLTSWNLTRDDNGRITQETVTVDGDTSNYLYTYDPLGRLLTVIKDSTLVEEYQYGLNGTRTYEMNTLRGISGRTFDYSDEDHLLTAGSATYQYNVDGFLTTKTDGADVTTYDYSSRGELLGVTLPDGTNIEYIHDPLGRRIAKLVNGVTTEKYLWQGLTRFLAVYDGTNNLIMRFEYADGRVPVAMTQGGATYYLTYDQVGSLRVVADASGNVVKRIDYDSFGNIIDDTNPSFSIPLGFAGGLHDIDTKLVRFGFRDYDPDIGRWTAKDPILFAGGDTDLYGYCLTDPVNAIDPAGLINWGAVVKGGFAVVGGGVTVGLGALASSSGVGALGGLPAVLGGTATVSWGVSQIIAGFTDNAIPFMGTGEAVIKGSTEEGLLQDELLGLNTLGSMLSTGRVQPSTIGKINTVIQSGYSIYNSGSQIKESVDSSCE
jgi:RHS repeat-associated protein